MVRHVSSDRQEREKYSLLLKCENQQQNDLKSQTSPSHTPLTSPPALFFILHRNPASLTHHPPSHPRLLITLSLGLPRVLQIDCSSIEIPISFFQRRGEKRREKESRKFLLLLTYLPRDQELCFRLQQPGGHFLHCLPFVHTPRQHSTHCPLSSARGKTSSWPASARYSLQDFSPYKDSSILSCLSPPGHRVNPQPCVV